MSRSVFPRGNKLQTVENMIDYVEFIKTIAAKEGFDRTLDAFDDAISALQAEHAERSVAAQEQLWKSA